jgi:hypothetical protein
MSDEPMADKSPEKRQFWTLFVLILGAFASLFVVSIVTSERPWSAHPALNPEVWVFVSGVAWIIARLLDAAINFWRHRR